MPSDGGYGDQTYLGLRAISIARAEQGRIEREMMEGAKAPPPKVKDG